MTVIIDITLILQILLFVLVLALAIYLLIPSKKKDRKRKDEPQNQSDESHNETPVPENDSERPTVINHYHYVIKYVNGKEVVEQEIDSDADTDDGSLYATTPDDASWSRDDLEMLRSLSRDPNPDSRKEKIEQLIKKGIVAEEERESLMNAREGAPMPEQQTTDTSTFPEVFPTPTDVENELFPDDFNVYPEIYKNN